jgi:hypothetical protein
MTRRYPDLPALILAAAVATPAFAQTAAKPAAAKPAPTAKTAPAKKPPAKAPPKPVVEAPLPQASQEQLTAAQLTYFGQYGCEFNQSLTIAMNPKDIGYVDVAFNKQVFVMKPVLSSTGALRLEDVRGRTLMIQIANKSMLMDVEAGRRLVDECLHERQVAFRAAPPPANMSPSLGIDPVKAAAAASAPQ